jgi:hypothetical protein
VYHLYFDIESKKRARKKMKILIENQNGEKNLRKPRANIASLPAGNLLISVLHNKKYD